jgi:hypothetical protein
MARSRSRSDLISVDPSLDEIVDALEDILEFAPGRSDPEWSGTSVPYSEAELDELRNELRATVARLESEAARVRWQLEMLDTSTRPAWYH